MGSNDCSGNEQNEMNKGMKLQILLLNMNLRCTDSMNISSSFDGVIVKQIGELIRGLFVNSAEVFSLSVKLETQRIREKKLCHKMS